MDCFLKTVGEGVDECPKAHSKSGLVPVVADLLDDQFPVPLKKMKSHYSTACKVRVVAKVLGRTTLDECCKHLLELIDFCCRFKFKKKLNCNYGLDDILTTIGAHLLSLRKWTSELNDRRSEKLKSMEDAISAAINSDIEMCKFFGVQNLPLFLITPLKKVPTLSQLCICYGSVVTCAAAAEVWG